MALHLNLLWHMHQPNYQDASGRLQMPWTFLHAIKDYYDMPYYLEDFSAIQCTFNLTPSLIAQLLRYEKEGASCDRFLDAWRKPSADLDEKERAFVIKICRSAQKETMVDPLPRLAQLYERSTYDDQALCDLEVLFLLAWCGPYLRRNDATIQALLAQGEGYTQADKEVLLETLMRFVPTILPYYRDLLKAGRIALATTPLNHPILPLLIDMHNAKRSDPLTQIPTNHFSLLSDAKRHIQGAIDLYEEVFDQRPSGFWPAEGAVDIESARLYKQYGIEWIATDEAILFRSLPQGVAEDLYDRFDYEGLSIAFRDHRLSDRIGFEYRHYHSDDAARDFIESLAHIAEVRPDATVSVILDGENAWEFYPQNGEPFFRAFYGALEKCSWCRCETMDTIAALPSRSLPTIHPGSWIGGTFHTWVGHSEKNRAWSLLYETQKAYQAHREKLSQDARDRALRHLLLAESSDWFWWYGEDHFTDFDQEFDTLFRHHLLHLYAIIGKEPPSELLMPIIGKEKPLRPFVVEPKEMIRPVIDGKKSSFFEWIDSGMIDEAALFSTMDGARGIVQRIYWGEDENNLYLRLDGDPKMLSAIEKVRLQIKETEMVVTIDMARHTQGDGLVAALEDVIEIGLSKKRFFGSKREVTLVIALIKEGRIVQTLPGIGALHVYLDPDYATHWFV